MNNNSILVDLSMNEQNSEEYTTEDWSAIMNALHDLYDDSDMYDTSMSLSTTTSNPNSPNSFTPRQLFNGEDIQIRNTDSEDSDDETETNSNSMSNFDIFTSNIQRATINDDDDSGSDSNSMANFDTTNTIIDNEDRAPYPYRSRNTRQPQSRKSPREISERKLLGIRSFANIYIEKAKLADRKGRNKLAIKYFAAAYELDPYMEYLSDYATCLEKDRQYKKAEMYYLEAIDNLDPRSTSNLAIYNLADMYLHLSKVKIKTSSGRIIHNEQQETVQITQTLPVRSESQESPIEFLNQKKEEETSTNRLVFSVDINNDNNEKEEEVTWYIDRNPKTENKDNNEKETPQETFKPFDDNKVYEPEIKPTPCYYRDKAIQYYTMAAERGDKESLEIVCMETFEYKPHLFVRFLSWILENKENHFVSNGCDDDDYEEDEINNRKFAIWIRKHQALSLRDYVLNVPSGPQNNFRGVCYIKRCLQLLDKEPIVNIYKNKVDLFTKLNHVTECGICYDKKLNIDLNCGHCVCTDCYKRVCHTSCPFCREPGLEGFLE